MTTLKLEGGVEETRHQAESKGRMSLADPVLGLAADVLDDLERSRIANENRLRQLTRSEVDSDGEARGFGLDMGSPDVRRMTALVEGLKEAEHQAGLYLKSVLRRHPLWVWAEPVSGIGEKQLARLLAVIGDPYLREQRNENDEVIGEPRQVSQLWSYCGYSVSEGRAVRRARGQQANWSTKAKTRTYLIMESCLKAHGRYPNRYGAFYYDRKAATLGRVHTVACAQCGGAGKAAAAIGKPWKDGHRHADALRVAGKKFLKDLWIESRRLHNPELP